MTVTGWMGRANGGGELAGWGGGEATAGPCGGASGRARDGWAVRGVVVLCPGAAANRTWQSGHMRRPPVRGVVHVHRDEEPLVNKPLEVGTHNVVAFSDVKLAFVVENNPGATHC